MEDFTWGPQAIMFINIRDLAEWQPSKEDVTSPDLNATDIIFTLRSSAWTLKTLDITSTRVKVMSVIIMTDNYKVVILIVIYKTSNVFHLPAIPV